MKKYIIRKSQPLCGMVRISGSKNAALPILAATLLCSEPVMLSNVPMLSDIEVLCEIMRLLGCRISSPTAQKLCIDSSDVCRFDAPYELTGKLRASFLISGPVLARFGKIRLALPGGCPIGTRPVDLHLKGLAALGAEIRREHGCLSLAARRLRGTRLYLDFPSVGATENILMACVLAEGESIIENASCEPEVLDLCGFLSAAGAQIEGAGTDTIRVLGVSRLRGAEYTIIPDRIEAGTFMTAAMMTHGDVVLADARPEHLLPVTAKLREMGADISVSEGGLRIRAVRPLHSLDVKTLPYPGFPTDMQAQMMALLACAEGTGIITETIFENRFMHAAELTRMGADIKLEGRCAVVHGKPCLAGAEVCATDLRAGAALVLAGLAAEGETALSGTEHIERGYENLIDKLRGLGADAEISEIP